MLALCRPALAAAAIAGARAGLGEAQTLDAPIRLIFDQAMDRKAWRRR
jgi:hypothetical protein